MLHPVFRSALFTLLLTLALTFAGTAKAQSTGGSFGSSYEEEGGDFGGHESHGRGRESYGEGHESYRGGYESGRTPYGRMDDRNPVPVHVPPPMFPPPSHPQLDVVWSPSEENDRLSSHELETIYPELVRLLEAKQFGPAHCPACYPRELMLCLHCGMPAEDPAPSSA